MVRFLETGTPPEGLFRADVFCDLTIPQWRLQAQGVEFKSPPTERFYGIEALFKDDSGNWFSLTQRTGAKTAEV